METQRSRLVHALAIRLMLYKRPTVFLHVSHGINANQIVGESGKESGSIGRPGQAGAGGDLAVFRLFGTERIDNHLGFEIPNLDRIVRGGTQPVPVGRKYQAIDNFTGIERVQSLAFVQIPQHRSVVLATRSR